MGSGVSGIKNGTATNMGYNDFIKYAAGLSEDERQKAIDDYAKRTKIDPNLIEDDIDGVILPNMSMATAADNRSFAENIAKAIKNDFQSSAVSDIQKAMDNAPVGTEMKLKNISLEKDTDGWYENTNGKRRKITAQGIYFTFKTD